MTSTIPIRRLTLYKHGVAYVEREGATAEHEVALATRAQEVNDLLKSLAVVDRAGGRVLGITYPTATDAAERLAGARLVLSERHSVRDLLQRLRGRTVRLTLGDGPDGATLSGRLVGIDLPRGGRHANGGSAAVLDEADGEVRLVRLAEIRAVGLGDEQTADELRYFLDASRGDAAQRTITVHLGSGAHDLALSYLTPFPAWRVSYRLSATSEASAADHTASPTDRTVSSAAEATAESGTLVLQGWGLFDNRFAEDLDAVAVTLVAGQPQSFVYDLAASRIPRRPVVGDEGYEITEPVEFGALASPAAATPAVANMALSVAERGPRRRAPVPPHLDAALAYQAAEGRSLGELFEYQVTEPVTAARGASALVPILSARLPYRRELLYNHDKLAAHPVATLRFANATGLVLERGPVTVLIDGAYRGEAIVPFAREDNEVNLAYAVEMGIAATVTRRDVTATVGLRLDGALLHLREAVNTHTTYRFESLLAAACTVTLEHAAGYEAELAETRAPEAVSGGAYRWRIACPPGAMTAFTVTERRHLWRETQLLDQSYEALRRYLEQRWLDDAAYARISGLLAERGAIARAGAEIERLRAAQGQLDAREERLRKNMAALGGAGAEGELRAQMVAELQGCEERHRELASAIAALEQEIATRQAALDAGLAALHAEPNEQPHPSSPEHRHDDGYA